MAERLAAPAVVVFDGGGGRGGTGSRRLERARDIARRALRRVLALIFGPDFIHWRRSGELWPSAWPRRRLLFLMAAVAAEARGRGGSSGLATSRVGPCGVCSL